MKAIRTNDNSNPTIEIHNNGSLGKTLIAGGVGAVAGGAAVFGAIKGPELIKKLKEKRAEKANGKKKPEDASQNTSKESGSSAPATPADSGASGQSSGSAPSESSKPVSPETNS